MHATLRFGALLLAFAWAASVPTPALAEEPATEPEKPGVATEVIDVGPIMPPPSGIEAIEVTGESLDATNVQDDAEAVTAFDSGGTGPAPDRQRRSFGDQRARPPCRPAGPERHHHAARRRHGEREHHRRAWRRFPRRRDLLRLTGLGAHRVLRRRSRSKSSAARRGSSAERTRPRAPSTSPRTIPPRTGRCAATTPWVTTTASAGAGRSTSPWAR